MAELDLVTDRCNWLCSTYLHSFLTGIVQKIFAFFEQICDPHSIDILMIVIGNPKNLSFGRVIEIKIKNLSIEILKTEETLSSLLFGFLNYSFEF